MTLTQGCNSLSALTATPTPVPLSFKECYDNGLNLVKEKKYEEAIGYFDKALAIEPDNLNACNDKGNALYSLGKYEESIKYYDKILEKDRNAAVIWCSKGNALAFLKKYNESLTCYEKALKIDPKNKDARSNKQNALKAIEGLKNTENLKNYMDKGNELYAKKKYNDAISYYDKILKINPASVDAWLYKGYCYHILKKYDKAIECYRKAIKNSPPDSPNQDALKAINDARGALSPSTNPFHELVDTQPVPSPMPDTSDNEIVYVMKTGDQYHSAGCSYLKNSKSPMSKKDAIKNGYRPCSSCNP